MVETLGGNEMENKEAWRRRSCRRHTISSTSLQQVDAKLPMFLGENGNVRTGRVIPTVSLMASLGTD